MKFSKGDVVIRERGYHSGMRPGDVAVVSEVREFGALVIVGYSPSRIWTHAPENFRMASPLERLTLNQFTYQIC